MCSVELHFPHESRTKGKVSERTNRFLLGIILMRRPCRSVDDSLRDEDETG
jgi:hypothetical protein